MASMGEMLAYAQAIQAGQVRSQHPDKSAAGALSRVIPGIQGGIASEQKRKQAEFEKMLKMIDTANTIKDIETKQLNNEITKNIGKMYGIIDYDEGELTNIRRSLNDSIGTGGEGVNPYAGSKTKKGKLNTLFADMEKQIDFSTKTGFKISFKDKKDRRTGGLTDNEMKEQIWKKAREMAINEEVERIGKTDKAKFLGIDRRAFTPRPDVINKYLPVAEEYLFGTKEGYKKLFKKKREELILPGDFNP